MKTRIKKTIRHVTELLILSVVLTIMGVLVYRGDCWNRGPRVSAEEAEKYTVSVINSLESIKEYLPYEPMQSLPNILPFERTSSAVEFMAHGTVTLRRETGESNMDVYYRVRRSTGEMESYRDHTKYTTGSFPYGVEEYTARAKAIVGTLTGVKYNLRMSGEPKLITDGNARGTVRFEWAVYTSDGVPVMDASILVVLNWRGELHSYGCSDLVDEPARETRISVAKAMASAEAALDEGCGSAKSSDGNKFCFTWSYTDLVVAYPARMRTRMGFSNRRITSEGPKARYIYRVGYSRVGKNQEWKYFRDSSRRIWANYVAVDAVTGEVLFAPRHLRNRCEQTKGEEKK